MNYSNTNSEYGAVKENEPNLTREDDGTLWWHFEITPEKHTLLANGDRLIEPQTYKYLQCKEVGGELVAVVPPVVRVKRVGEARTLKAA